MEKTGLAKKIWEEGKSDDCPIIDVHGHMGRWKGIYFPYSEPHKMIESMDRAGVRMVIFSHHAALSSPDIMNKYSVEAVRKYPERFRAYCVINPNYPLLSELEIKNYEKYDDIYAGFKFHGDFHNVPYDDKGYEKAWQYADQKGKVVLLHTWGSSSYCNEAIIRKVAEKYINTKIILGHSLHDYWDRAVKLVNEYNNMYLDLCAVLDERAGILERFVDQAGADRILFGTDIPWFSLHYYIGMVLAAGIDDSDRRKIFYENAHGLFNL